jgi:hypothetical protein
MLLSAALVAAGALTSMAQSSVYSLNVVGYVNVPVYPGLNLIAAPLQNADATSNPQSVLGTFSPVLQGNSLLFIYNPTNAATGPGTGTGSGGFDQNLIAGGDGNWYSSVSGQTPPDPSEGTCPPGTSFFVVNNCGPGTGNPATTNILTIVGSVVQGTNNYTVFPGLNFLADPVSVAQDISTNGFPVIDNDLLFTWGDGSDGGGPVVASPWNSAYDQNLIGEGNDGPGTGPAFLDPNSGNPVPVALAPGAGFVYVNSGSARTWTRSFTVQ